MVFGNFGHVCSETFAQLFGVGNLEDKEKCFSIKRRNDSANWAAEYILRA